MLSMYLVCELHTLRSSMSVGPTTGGAAGKTFRLGDMLDRHVYGGEGIESVLLLAAGQRIDSLAQLRMLQEAGFEVDFSQSGKPPPSKADGLKRSADSAQRSREEFQQRLLVASKVRQQVSRAASALLAKVRAGGAPDAADLLPAGAELAAQVTSDPYTVASLTHLGRCDEYTLEHSVDVSILMAALASVLGEPQEKLTAIVIAGLLHDVGKQRIPVEILQKPGPLTPAEFEEVKKHPQYGYDIIRNEVKCPQVMALPALQHHEREDGSGYPAGCYGKDMHRYGRMASVADSFDAMTAERVYSDAKSAWSALSELMVRCREQYHQPTVMALVKLLGVFPVGTRIVLDSGERGEVVAPNPADGSRPIVLVDRDRRGHALAYPYNLNLASSERRITGAKA